MKKKSVTKRIMPLFLILILVVSLFPPLTAFAAAIDKPTDLISERLSDTTAKVTFAKSLSGNYYYVIQDVDEPTPTQTQVENNFNGTGGSGALFFSPVNTNTINLDSSDGLAAGREMNVFLLLKNTDNNYSDVIPVRIAEYGVLKIGEGRNSTGYVPWTGTSTINVASNITTVKILNAAPGDYVRTLNVAHSGVTIEGLGSATPIIGLGVYVAANDVTLKDLYLTNNSNVDSDVNFGDYQNPGVGSFTLNIDGDVHIDKAVDRGSANIYSWGALTIGGGAGNSLTINGSTVMKGDVVVSVPLTIHEFQGYAALETDGALTINSPTVITGSTTNGYSAIRSAGDITLNAPLNVTGPDRNAGGDGGSAVPGAGCAIDIQTAGKFVIFNGKTPDVSLTIKDGANSVSPQNALNFKMGTVSNAKWFGVSGGVNATTAAPVFTALTNVYLDDPGTNHAPTLKGGVANPSTASVTVNNAYTLNLSNIFEDADGDSLTYSVNIDSGGYNAANAAYSYTPTAEGTETLVFKANDGTTDSPTYTVNLTVNAVPTAQIPNITAQPQSDSITSGNTKALSVTASVTDGGTLSYQWYSNTTASNSGGSVIGGAIGATYTTPALSATAYYYVVVTNTKGGVTATATSNAVTVTVNPAPPTLTAGISYRSSHITVSISFSSNKTGTYYYIVKETGDAAPNAAAIKASGVSGALGTSNAISATITPGAKKVYVTGEDTNAVLGNVIVFDVRAYTPSFADSSVTLTLSADNIIYIFNDGYVIGNIGDAVPVAAADLHIGNYTIGINSSSAEVNAAIMVMADYDGLANGRNITIKDLSLKTTSVSPLTLQGGAKASVILSGRNRLYPDSGNFAAVNVPQNSTLLIDGTGMLEAYAKTNGYGAGIGGNNGQSAGTIYISGSTGITAQSGGGAGIGGGYGGNGGTITISSGTTKAVSDGGGAGIGGGSGGNGGTITISGGTNSAKANSKGSGASIGGGYKGDGGTITISGGSTLATNNGDGACIGGGSGGNGGTITISGGTITATVGSSNSNYGIASNASGKVIINGGSVKATGGAGAIDVQPVNAAKEPVYLGELAGQKGVTSVLVDGVDWGIAANHPGDDALYLYMAHGADTHSVTANGVHYTATWNGTGFTITKNTNNNNSSGNNSSGNTAVLPRTSAQPGYTITFPSILGNSGTAVPIINPTDGKDFPIYIADAVYGNILGFELDGNGIDKQTLAVLVKSYVSAEGYNGNILRNTVLNNLNMALYNYVVNGTDEQLKSLKDKLGDAKNELKKANFSDEDKQKIQDWLDAIDAIINPKTPSIDVGAGKTVTLDPLTTTLLTAQNADGTVVIGIAFPGSVGIVLFNEYLATLKDGKHNLTVAFNDSSEAVIAFEVKNEAISAESRQNPATSTNNTGNLSNSGADGGLPSTDSVNPALIVLLIVIVILAAGLILFLLRRRKRAVV
jgi:LPXTG-motif cell wall-anchored protein